MKYTFYKPLSIALIVTATVCSSAFGMEEKKGKVREATSYNSYKGIIIGKDTIDQLATKYGLPEEQAAVVREWRNNNIGLIKRMTEFTVPNSQWRNHMHETKELLAQQGIDYVGKGDVNQDGRSYNFQLPVNENLYFHAASLPNRIHNLARQAKQAWNFPREKMDTFAKVPTYQTVSEFTNGLLFAQAADENNFNHFSAPKTYLFPVNDDQVGYNDDNSFVLQERLDLETQLFDKENPKRLRTLLNENPQAFDELMVATYAVGLWDSSKTLVDSDNKLHIRSLRLPNNNKPHKFLHKNKKSGEYSCYSSNTACGFTEFYNFCKEHKITEGQTMIQDFVRNKVHLPYEAKQKELEHTLELNK